MNDPFPLILLAERSRFESLRWLSAIGRPEQQLEDAGLLQTTTPSTPLATWNDKFEEIRLASLMDYRDAVAAADFDLYKSMNPMFSQGNSWWRERLLGSISLPPHTFEAIPFFDSHLAVEAMRVVVHRTVAAAGGPVDEFTEQVDLVLSTGHAQVGYHGA